MTINFQFELKSLGERYTNKPNKKLLAGTDVWIFGAGQFGQDLSIAFKSEGHCVAGFVESKPACKQVQGLSVLNWLEWSPEHSSAPLCIGIFNRNMPLDELEIVAKKNGAHDLYFPWDLYPSFEIQMGWRFWLSKPELIMSHLDDLAKVMSLLSDDFSKKCLVDIATFRLGLNTSYASFHHTENQYFNHLTLKSLKNNPVCYIDGGAYTGDTFLELCKLVDVQKSYLFEPDADNFEKLVLNTLKSYQSVHCLPIGLSDRYEILSFSAGLGEGASIQETGTAHIAVAALDTLITGQEKVDFIKLDVEGAEKKALDGAKQLIVRSRPVLAISLYHQPQDLWELPLFLSTICENYKFYIRQHCANSFDSVLYAVPKESIQSI